MVLRADAEGIWGGSLAADPADPLPRVRMGELFLAKHDSRNARDLFQDVLQQNPAHAEALLGSTLVTHQTGPEGRVVTKLLVEEGLAISTEFYAALAIDRKRGCPVVIASAEGGVTRWPRGFWIAAIVRSAISAM